MTRVADICTEPQEPWRAATRFHDLGSVVVFFADDGTYETRLLWITDGTPAGTLPLAVPGLVLPDDGSASVHDGVLLFSASDWSYGHEPWRSDGTVAGTHRLRDVAPGPANGIARTWATMGGLAWFGTQAEPSLQGQLWRTDGTPAGTIAAADVLVGLSMLTLRSRLVFEGASPQGETGDLWSSDGTAAGTSVTWDFRDGAPPRHLTLAGPEIIFNGNDDAFGREPWMTDGTTAGTRQLADLNPGFSSSEPDGFAAAGGFTFFAANDGSTGREAWMTDGTTVGTRIIADIRPGSAGSSPSSPCAMGGRVYFAADDGVSGSELWVTDGTPAGTSLLADILPGSEGSAPRGLLVTPWGLVFSADDGVSGREPWISDGTSAGTRLFADVEPGPGGSEPMAFATGVGKLFFTACTSVSGCEPWVSDGTASGTTLLVDATPSMAGSFPFDLLAAGDTVHFMAFDGTAQGSGLWLSDGTAAGTRPHDGANPPPGGSSWMLLASLRDRVLALNIGGPDAPALFSLSATGGDPARLGECDWSDTPLSVVGDQAIFSGFDPTAGPEPFITDGTVAGTRLLADTIPGTGGPDGVAHAPAGARATFLGRSADGTGFEWLASDMSGAGTGVIPGSPPMTIQRHPAFPAGYAPRGWSASGWAVAAAEDPVAGTEPWITDGTPAGTRSLGDLTPGTASTWMTDVAAFRGGMLLCLDTGSGREPWFSDGTPAGTVPLGDLHPGPGESWPMQFTAVGSFALFAANDGVTGYELWRTDGTAAGTMRVKDIFPGTPGSDPLDMLVAAPGLVLFSANDGLAGREIWISDGTESGTRLWAEVRPGPQSGHPHEFTRVGSRIVFAADDGTGRELFRLDPDASEQCSNGSDDDGDGATDCADSDCAADLACVDADADGVLDSEDCDPLDPGTHHVPGEIGLLLAARSGDALLSWPDPAPSAGASSRVDLASTSLSDLAIGNWSCVADDATSPWVDARPGSWAYLGRAANSCGPAPDAGWGTLSDGTARALSCP